MNRAAYQREIRSGCAECGAWTLSGSYCAECKFYLDRLAEFGEARAADRWASYLDASELPDSFRELWLSPAVPLLIRGERLYVVIPARQRRWIERRLGAVLDAAGISLVSVERGVRLVREDRGVAR